MRPVPLHFVDSGGAGEPVLLAHAIGCDHHLWDALVPCLAPRFRTIAVDLRGHGASPAPARPYTLEMLADDACAVLEKLGIARAHWVGLSLGGMVGQAFALRHPARLGRLVIANSSSGYGPDGAAMWKTRIRQIEQGGLAGFRETAEQRWFTPGFRAARPEAVESVMGCFLKTTVGGYLGCCDAIAALDYGDDLIRIKAKTLVIAGENDVGTPVAMSQAIASGIPGAKLAVIPGAAHMSIIEKPEEFCELVVDFLSQGA